MRLAGHRGTGLCAPFGPFEEVELAAAVCEAGGLGGLGTGPRSLGELEAEWQRLRELTDRPFAINHTIRPFDPDAFEATLRFAPAAISFHIGVFPELIERARDAGMPLAPAGDRPSTAPRRPSRPAPT